MLRCFRINPADNVATMLDDANAAGGVANVLGGDGVISVELREPIALGHKVALRDIATGAPIIKFGVTIGRAFKDIRAGDWVHLQNCCSEFDERSGTLDLQTGAATDTKYE
jgi:altronate dehydratase small subunit